MAHSGCMGCTRRHVGCHAECPTYQAYRKELDEKNAIEARERYLHNINVKHWQRVHGKWVRKK